MKRLIFPLIFLLSLSSFSQDHDEFIATIIGDKEAFLSSKTGEFVFREHAKTDVNALYTTDSGTVIYEDRKIHAVKKGETLSAIAKKHGITISQLKTQNKTKSSNLNIGQKLKITIKHVVPSSKPVVNQAEGKIIARLAPGQTPGGMTPPDLPPDAMPGNTINLIADTKPEVTSIEKEKVEELTNDGSTVHVVKRGETLFTIAKKYKMSIKDLKENNNLALNNLSVGQKLNISVYNPAVLSQSSRPDKVAAKPVPEKKDLAMLTKKDPVDTRKPSIKKETISAKEEIKEEAKINPEKEKVKTKTEEVKVKADTKKEAQVEKLIEKYSKKDSATEKVEVASKMETKDLEAKVETKKEKVKAKIEKVEVKADAKKEEQVKKLIEKYAKKDTPSKKVEAASKPDSPKAVIHIVKKGESLWGISRKYKMTVADLIKLNGLKSNNLSIGQELKIK